MFKSSPPVSEHNFGGGKLSAPDILFKGIPRGPTRGYTARSIAVMRPGRVVIPCCGSFSLAAVARQAGCSAASVACGDVSLYSTALGRAIMGEDWRLDLRDGILVDGLAEILEPLLSDPVSKATAVLFAIRVLQYQKKHQKRFHKDLQRELILNAEEYIRQLRYQVEGLRDDLHGLQYHARDMWETLEEHRHDESTMLLVNPPRYDGGYVRMFAGVDDVFDWDEPEYTQFMESDYDRLMELLGDSAATTFMYYATQGEDPAEMWGEPWRSVFADKPSNKKVAAINWIVANHSVVAHVVNRPRLTEGVAKYPLFDGEVSKDSKLWAERVPREVGDYYRDLFIHRLPGSLTEIYVALLLDGYLLASVGIHLRNWRTGGGKGADSGDMAPASLTFAFSVPHDTYRRLHKLTLLSVLGSWFWEDILSEEQSYALAGIPTRLQSTMLTPYPENKTARGTGLKLAAREQQDDGTYKLTYYGDIVDRTREETVELWLNKYGSLTK
jgi:hypothetical protein